MKIQASGIKPATYCIFRHVVPALPYTCCDTGNGFVDRSQGKKYQFDSVAISPPAIDHAGVGHAGQSGFECETGAKSRMVGDPPSASSARHERPQPRAGGEMPAAIRSALTNTGQSPSLGRNSRANVVLPAPLGPAMTTIFFWAGILLMKSYAKRYPLGRRWRDGDLHGSHVVARSVISINWPRAVVLLVVGRSEVVKPRRRLRNEGR